MFALDGPADGVKGRDYRTEVERWRQKREQDLKADDGWLTLAGLHWLRPGETRLGADPASDVLLPPSAPPKVGALTLSDGRGQFRIEKDVAVTRNGEAFEGGEIRSDADGPADVLGVGDVKFLLIKRGDRFALRVKDNRNPAREAFSGLNWFPVDESWRIKARFEPNRTTTAVVLDTIVGEQETLESPGDVVFKRGDKSYRLQAVREGDRLWIVFRDGTSGRLTHPNARQLYADAPDKDGVVILDFNKAINLPCAFTPYATCPIPPRRNRLDLPITAGEQKYPPPPKASAAP